MCTDLEPMCEKNLQVPLDSLTNRAPRNRLPPAERHPSRSQLHVPTLPPPQSDRPPPSLFFAVPFRWTTSAQRGPHARADGDALAAARNPAEAKPTPSNACGQTATFLATKPRSGTTPAKHPSEGIQRPGVFRTARSRSSRRQPETASERARTRFRGQNRTISPHGRQRLAAQTVTHDRRASVEGPVPSDGHASPFPTSVLHRARRGSARDGHFAQVKRCGRPSIAAPFPAPAKQHRTQQSLTRSRGEPSIRALPCHRMMPHERSIRPKRRQRTEIMLAKRQNRIEHTPESHGKRVGSASESHKLSPSIRWRRAIGTQDPPATMNPAGPRNDNQSFF